MLTGKAKATPLVNVQEIDQEDEAQQKTLKLSFLGTDHGRLKENRSAGGKHAHKSFDNVLVDGLSQNYQMSRQ